MRAGEYLKRINIICVDHEDRCKPGGCPLHDYQCGIPKDTKKIPEVIKLVEDYEKKANELKPCPFCGSKVSLEEIEPHTHKIAAFMPDHPGSWFIECECGIAIIGEKKQEVIDRWNLRKLLERSLREGNDESKAT